MKRLPKKHDLRYQRQGGIFNEVEVYCARCWQPVDPEEADEPCPGTDDPFTETVLLGFAAAVLLLVLWWVAGFPVPGVTR